MVYRERGGWKRDRERERGKAEGTLMGEQGMRSLLDIWRRTRQDEMLENGIRYWIRDTFSTTNLK